MCRLQPCAAAGCNPISPKQAEQLFEWGLRRNANCSLCHSNLGDVRLKLDEPNPNPDPNPDPKPKPNPKQSGEEFVIAAREADALGATLLLG